MKRFIVIIVCSFVVLTVTKGQVNNKPDITATVPVPKLTPDAIPPAYSSMAKLNYFKSWDAMARVSNPSSITNLPYTEVRQTTTFVDGFGRSIQIVNKQSSPLDNNGNAYDIISVANYDILGRESNKYMPYSDNSNSGGFRLNSFQDQNAFNQSQYTGEQVFYSKIQFEASPLNRVEKTMASGNSWAGSNVGVAINSSVNLESDKVLIWNIEYCRNFYENNYTSVKLPESKGYYLEGQLSKRVLTDENGNQTLEFKDKQGRVLLKRVMNFEQPDHGPANIEYTWLNTYYIYDDFGRLCFVITPKASRYIAINQLTTVPENIANELCFQYVFDPSHRLIGKKVPGAGWVFMVYDKRDRVVFTKDSRQIGINQWNVILYDLINRPVITGVINYSINRRDLQDWVDVNTGNDTRTLFANNAMVSDNPLPTGSNLIILTQTFYDNYDWTTKTYSSADNFKLDPGNNQHSELLPSIANTQLVRNAITGKLVKTMPRPSNLNIGVFLSTVNFFDFDGRTIQVQSDNVKGGVDISTSLYNFLGKELCNYLVHNNPASLATPSTKVKTNYEYDYGGRLTKIYKTINDISIAKHLAAKYEYNRLGQLIKKELGTKTSGGALENQNFEYNVRGWLKAINKDYAKNINNNNWFGLETNYDWGFSKNQLNGNISGTKWRSNGDGVMRAYGYDYDALNRIQYGDFSQNISGSSYADDPKVNFDMQMGEFINNKWRNAYDENGNILKMKQYGLLINDSKIIDDLQYNYYENTNKLKNVIDSKSDYDSKLGDFKYSRTYDFSFGGVKPTTAADYKYDINGNLLTDLNKDIGDINTNGIVYNILNLPNTVTVTNKGVITYLYDALGNKLSKKVSEIGKPDKVTDYVDGFIYEDNKLQFFGHEEGRVRYLTIAAGDPPTNFTYDYYVKDHLGNVRMVLTEEQKIDHYPTATLEGSGTGSPLENEKAYYDINNTYVVPTPTNVPTYINDNGTNNPNTFGSPTANSQQMYKLNAGTNATGLGMVLKVMSGDAMDILGKSYYKTTGLPPITNTPFTAQNIINAFLGVSGGNNPAALHGATAAALNANTSGTVNPIGLFSNNPNNTNTSNNVKAGICYILFDEQFNYVSSGGGFDPVDNSTSGGLKNHFLKNIPVTKNGYIYIYCSNESNVDVFFDNLEIVHTRGPLLEETHYYPWGLAMAGISSKAATSLSNRIKFNGNEEQREEFADGSGLEWMDFNARTYDGQIGRFWQIDPLAELTRRWSPYVFAFDNPIRFIDPLGQLATDSTQPQSEFVNPPTPVSISKDANGVTSYTYEEVSVTAKLKVNAEKSDGGWFDSFGSFINHAVDFIPFVGSIKQIAVGIYNGDWKEIAMGVGGLALDIFTAGEGGSLLRIGENVGKEMVEAEVKEIAEREIREVLEKNIAEETEKVVAKACGCFMPGTLILTDSGYKKIEEIKIGDIVWAYNDTTHSYGKKQVVKLFTHIRDTIYQVHIGNEVVNTTSDHPFFVAGRWLKVATLKVGDSVSTYKGNKLAISQINLVVKRTIVYNFEVADYHTYYVAKQKILVHNSGPCDVNVKSFDEARVEAFDKAGIKDGKFDMAKASEKADPKTGTLTEFKGKDGSKVGYDGPHKSPGPHHDKQHISWQSGGKRGNGGTQRGNIPYNGQRHPSRPSRK